MKLSLRILAPALLLFLAACDAQRSHLPSAPGEAEPARADAGLDGPRIVIHSNVAGSWRPGDPPEVREVFAGNGLRFDWSALPGPSGTPVSCFSYAIDDSSDWSPCSDTIEWPPQPEGEELLWFPDAGPHAFFVRAVDEAGFASVLAADLLVFNGPRFCDEADRRIVVVLDTDPQSLIANTILPPSYPAIERALVNTWFAGYNVVVHETNGLEPPSVSLLDCASSVFWIHTASVEEGDSSVLEDAHTGSHNPLPSYVSSGGNLFVCGIQPSQALRYFDGPAGPALQAYPVVFGATLDSPDFFPHWAATHLGIDRVSESVGVTTQPDLEPLRLRTATSEITGGANPYPDLAFDELTWPQGPLQRGFGYYDRDVRAIGGPPFPGAEVIYSFNDEGIPIAVRRLIQPGLFGNTVFVGFHPYFLDRPAFTAFVDAVMRDFGERRGRVKQTGLAPDF